MLKKSLIALIVLVSILFLFTYPKVYVIRGSAGGVLYWNANEALLFMGGGISGAHMSYPRYGLEPLLVSLGDVLPPSHGHCLRDTVIRITDKDVQHYDANLYLDPQDQFCGMQLVVFRGQIYKGFLAKGPIWKWSGSQFEATTQEELRGFNPMEEASLPHPWDLDNMDGWSVRWLGYTTPKYQFALNAQPLTIIFHGPTWPPAPLSVDLVRPGQPPQTVWSFDEEPHRVSKAEYESAFAKH